MIFKGMRFRRNHSIQWHVQKHADGADYVYFCYKRSQKTILLTGHSRTDMAYAADGLVLLVKDGQVWQSGRVRRD